MIIYLIKVFQLLLSNKIGQLFIKKAYKNCDKSYEPIQELDIWGGVGLGKTWLMDLFYQIFTRW